MKQVGTFGGRYIMNRVVLVGNLVNNPELNYTGSGVAVCGFRLAVQRSFKNQSGEREADFVPVVVWRERAEFCSRYLKKGKKCAVSGRIATRFWDDDASVRHYVTEIVADEVEFLSPKDEYGDSNSDRAGTDGCNSSGHGASYAKDDGSGSKDSGVDGFKSVSDDEDELPF